MEIRGEEFIKKVQLKQEKDGIEQRLNEINDAEAVYQEPVHQTNHSRLDKEIEIQEEQEYLDEQGSDPLIDLKQQEINIKAMDQERKAGVDSAKLELDAAKLQQTAKIAQDKIDSQEDIAQLRANVNLQKQNQNNAKRDR